MRRVFLGRGTEERTAAKGLIRVISAMGSQSLN